MFKMKAQGYIFIIIILYINTIYDMMQRDV